MVSNWLLTLADCRDREFRRVMSQELRDAVDHFAKQWTTWAAEGGDVPLSYTVGYYKIAGTTYFVICCVDKSALDRYEKDVKRIRITTGE